MASAGPKRCSNKMKELPEKQILNFFGFSNLATGISILVLVERQKTIIHARSGKRRDTPGKGFGRSLRAEIFMEFLRRKG